MNNQHLDFLYLSEPDMIKAGVLDANHCVQTIEEVFTLLSQGDYIMGGPNENEHGIMLFFPNEQRFPNMPVAGPDRRFMSMITYLGGRFNICGDKWYGSNIANRENGLPRSVLMVTINDSDTGQPLAYMSGNLISAMRTGAVPGVAAKYLAIKHAEVATVIGAGVISRACLKAIVATRPDLKEIRVYDIVLEKGKIFAEEMSKDTGIKVVAAKSIQDAVDQSDIISVATSGYAKVRIEQEWLKPGCIIELTGPADLNDEFYIDNKIVADNWKMHESWLNDAKEHPLGFESIKDWAPTSQLLWLIETGKVKSEDIINLGDVVTGKRKVRTNESDNIIFVTGGMPVYDVAWAHEVYQNALSKGIGQKLVLWESPHWA
jgi:ornithine cyclodeaminase/alanine dehydrogenase-like protein (mu-crystallin family)